MLIDGIAGGLDDEDIDAAYVLEQLEVDFAIGEALNLRFSDGDSDIAADFVGEGPIGGAGKELEALVLTEIAGALPLGGGLGVPGSRVRLAGLVWPFGTVSAVFALVVSAGVLLVFYCDGHRSHFHLSTYLQAGLLFGCSNCVEQDVGWATWIRTRINASKGHCPTIERSPNLANPTARLDSPLDSRKRVSLPHSRHVNRTFLQKHLLPVRTAREGASQYRPHLDFRQSRLRCFCVATGCVQPVECRTGPRQRGAESCLRCTGARKKTLDVAEDGLLRKDDTFEVVLDPARNPGADKRGLLRSGQVFSI